LSRHVQVQLRPLRCRLDTSRRSTLVDSPSAAQALMGVDTHGCSKGFCSVDQSSCSSSPSGVDTFRCSIRLCSVVDGLDNSNFGNDLKWLISKLNNHEVIRAHHCRLSVQTL